ncbi:hypothetical protein J3F83DRAFT_568252 [Trichoderma novae-zelandiae]
MHRILLHLLILSRASAQDIFSLSLSYHHPHPLTSHLLPLLRTTAITCYPSISRQTRSDVVRMLYHLLFSGQQVQSLARTWVPVHMSPSSEWHAVPRVDDSTNDIIARSSVFPLPAVQHVIMRAPWWQIAV